MWSASKNFMGGESSGPAHAHGQINPFKNFVLSGAWRNYFQ